MPLSLPNLDDRTFADLTAELRSLIPRHDPGWTNHNPSDPGIMLMELFAWLGETVLYRMNRVQDRTYRAFLDLCGVQPAAAQAIITFEIRIDKNALPAGFIIPRGTGAAARDDKTGAEILFETTARIEAGDDHWDDTRALWVFKAPAIHTVPVENEFLGISNGRANQEFKLRQLPVFLTSEDEQFEGNPKILVDSEVWQYRNDLLTSGPTALEPNRPTAPEFAVVRLDNIVRFGDGTLGKIPETGSRIVCTYSRIGGTQGNVGPDQIIVLKDGFANIDPMFISVFNEMPAEGGVDRETLDDLMASGLRTIRKQYRAVSSLDFETLAKEAAQDKIARVLVVPNMNLQSVTPLSEGHISVIVLPKREYAASQAALNKEIFRYLDERRLITTVLHVVEPTYTTVRIDISVKARSGAITGMVESEVRAAITQFLDPHEGWEDKQGWPFGRAVYRSELYALIEGLKGVDHLESLQFLCDGSAPCNEAIPVGEHDLVRVLPEDVKVTVV